MVEAGGAVVVRSLQIWTEIGNRTENEQESSDPISCHKICDSECLIQSGLIQIWNFSVPIDGLEFLFFLVNKMFKS